MILIILLGTFFVIYILLFTRDSFINREYDKYMVVATNPYLIRDQIPSTYKTFKKIKV